MFIRLLSVYTIESFGESLVSNSKRFVKCVSLNNHPCQARAILNSINSNETPFFNLLLVLISLVEVVTLLMIHILIFVLQIR